MTHEELRTKLAEAGWEDVEGRGECYRYVNSQILINDRIPAVLCMCSSAGDGTFDVEREMSLDEASRWASTSFSPSTDKRRTKCACG